MTWMPKTFLKVIMAATEDDEDEEKQHGCGPVKIYPNPNANAHYITIIQILHGIIPI